MACIRILVNDQLYLFPIFVVEMKKRNTCDEVKFKMPFFLGILLCVTWIFILPVHSVNVDAFNDLLSRKSACGVLGNTRNKSCRSSNAARKPTIATK